MYVCILFDLLSRAFKNEKGVVNNVERMSLRQISNLIEPCTSFATTVLASLIMLLPLYPWYINFELDHSISFDL